MKKLKNKIKRLAIIPARLGSTRIKKKNIKLFNGKPMISYPIRELKESKIFKKIFVSTEDNLVKKISQKYGASVDFLRPKNLSKDRIPLNLVLKNVLSEFDKRSEIYDEIWLVYPCNPLLNKFDIVEAKKKFEKTSKVYPMISIKEFEAPIEWAFEKKNNIYKSINKKKLYTDSKKIKKKYFESASFIIYTRKQLLNYQRYHDYYGYLMKSHKAIDIDTKNDWEHALKLFNVKD
tara:strand:- start:8343 stop:9044 length:702 start_codon:yes stop_codon:yes gene_type:complete